METIIQENTLMDVPSVSEWILAGKIMVLSGDESVLRQLPQGNWIGGTIPYFYLKSENGRVDKDHIFVSDFSEHISDFRIASYKEAHLKNVCLDGFGNGFNFLILPALRDIHLSFALNAPQYENLYQNPLIGLIAGVDLDEFSVGALSKTFNGLTGESYTDEALVLQARLPAHKVARLEIINVFEPSQNMRLEVEEDTFTVKECFIHGEKTNLYRYIKENNIDISLPLVSDYGGASVNVSFLRLDDVKEMVIFYAPLFKGRTYSLAQSIGGYTQTFCSKAQAVLERENSIIYNCNCILNYLYGGLDKNHIGFSGPTTFGEVAFHLLNQTFTYLAIDERA